LSQAQAVVEARAARRAFAHLLREVVKQGVCCSCGACAASCTPNSIAFTGEEPALVGPCWVCEACYYQCPRTGLDIPAIEKMAFGTTRTGDDELGVSVGMYSGRSTDPDILRRATDGGCVTSLLVHALESKTADSCVTSVLSIAPPWRPKAHVALSREQVLEAAGTKYTPSQTLLGLGSAAHEYGKRRVVVVGLPCEVQAIRKMQMQPWGMAQVSSRVALAIGLFCHGNFSYNSFIEGYVRSEKGVDPGTITGMRISEGYLHLFKGEEEMLKAPVKEFSGSRRGACNVCTDFASELADISVGRIGSPRGWNTVITRSEAGEKLVQGALRRGLIELRPLADVEPGLPAVVKMTRAKRARALKHLKA